jgi:hypothetical protein
MMESLPASDPQQTDFSSAVALMKQSVSFVEKRLDTADNRAQIIDAQRRMTSQGPINLLDNRKRLYIREALLGKDYVFLFSTIIRACALSRSQSQRSLSVSLTISVSVSCHGGVFYHLVEWCGR